MDPLRAHLERHVAERPDHPALLEKNPAGGFRPVTYRDLSERADAFARAFAASRGPILPLYVAKTADCVAAMLGALQADRAFSVLNKRLKAPQVAAVLRATGAAVAGIDGPGLIACASGFSGDEAFLGAEWLVFRDAAWIDAYERGLEAARAAGARLRLWPEEAALPDGIAAAASTEADEADPIGCCLFTSGSTGEPKGVLIGRDDLTRRAEAEADWFGLTPDDVLLSMLPFSFDVGLNQCLSALTAGATLVLLDSWLPADILQAAAECRVTGISGVPAIWRDMIANGQRFDTTGSHATLRYLTVSGGDLPPTHLEALPDLAPGAGIFKTYGQTEAFRATSLRPEEFAARPRSVGRPFPGARVYVVGEDGTPCESGVEGEVVHTGLGVMRGYLSGDDPENKRRANPFRGDSDPSEWAIFTGDLGELDAEGYLTLHGRRDGMLKVAGNRVYPAEVAAGLLVLPEIRDAEVVGVKDAEGETQLVAFVISDPEAEASPAKLRRKAAAALPAYMVPRQVVPVAGFPRTASGKPDRVALVRQAQKLTHPPGADMKRS